MSMNIGETKTISICKRNRDSKWVNGQERKTTKDMKMIVSIEKNERGQKVSITKYI